MGPFKADLWGLESGTLEDISMTWEAQFSRLFDLLRVHNTKEYVEDYIQPAVVKPRLSDYLTREVEADEVGDLAD